MSEFAFRKKESRRDGTVSPGRAAVSGGEPPIQSLRDSRTASLADVMRSAGEYAVDLWQRGWLYADVMRERGNQYSEHLAEVVPHVLSFEYELVMGGPTLPRPVNYGLVRI